MSWSVSAIGKPAAVLAKLVKDITQVKCAEPEETIKAKVGECIATALAAFPESYAVKVMANGSQSPEYANGAPTGKFTNNLSVSIEPIWGFVE